MKQTTNPFQAEDEAASEAWEHKKAATRYEQLGQVAHEVKQVAAWVTLYFLLQGALASRRQRKAEKRAQVARETRELAAEVDAAFADVPEAS